MHVRTGMFMNSFDGGKVRFRSMRLIGNRGYHSQTCPPHPKRLGAIFPRPTFSPVHTRQTMYYKAEKKQKKTPKCESL